MHQFSGDCKKACKFGTQNYRIKQPVGAKLMNIRPRRNEGYRD